MGLERHIHELLYHHDCVIVPHWGGFLAHYRPARLDEARQLVHPPGKDISFNRHLTRNDGLLADHLAKREGVRFDQAAAHIELEVERWQKDLQRTGRLELPGIGIFYPDAEQNLQFDPDRKVNYLKDAYALRPVAALPMEQPKEVPVLRVPPPVVAEQPRAGMSPWWAAAAAAALAVFLAGTWWLGTQQGGTQWSAFSWPAQAPRTYTAPPASEQREVATAGLFSLPEEPLGVQQVPLGEGDSIMLTVDLGVPPAAAAPADTTRVAVVNMPPVHASDPLKFHVVAGCFAQPENADRYAHELQAKGHPARILAPRNNLHPVVYGSHATRQEALDMLARVRAEGAPQAWLLVR